MSVRRSWLAAACALAAGTVVGAPALAAPLDFAPGQKFEASCSDPIRTTTLTPLPGDGAFTPYRLGTGQLLVPTEFRLTSADPGLKARHLLVEGDDLVASRSGASSAVVKCEISGTIGSDSFTAVITGSVVGARR